MSAPELINGEADMSISLRGLLLATVTSFGLAACGGGAGVFGIDAMVRVGEWEALMLCP